LPSARVLDLGVEAAAKRLHKARDRERSSGLGTAAEAEAQNRPPWQRGDQSDVARTSTCVLPGQGAVTVKILPAVAFTDIARTRRAERVRLSFIDGREGETERTLLRRKHAARCITLDFRRVVA